MNPLLKSIVMVFAVVLLSGCTWSREFGPYKGRVVDLETHEPIEGAVVFMRFYTNFLLSPGGDLSKFEDALEVLTDENGMFEIPKHKIQRLRLFHEWEPQGDVIIFKPGYGAYPRHPKVKPKPSLPLPEDEFVVIWLPKLKTREERIDNLSNLYPGSAPSDAFKILRNLERIERKETGIDP